MPTWTCLFFVFVAILPVVPLLFVLDYWRQARPPREWIWISEDSRTMYVDAAKTLITASGIAVALLTFSAPARTANPLVAISAKIAVVCLIASVCFSLILILAFLRAFQHSEARYMDEERNAGRPATSGQGKLNKSELLSILVLTWFALSCFLVGFAFLGRIAFHV